MANEMTEAEKVEWTRRHMSCQFVDLATKMLADKKRLATLEANGEITPEQQKDLEVIKFNIEELKRLVKDSPPLADPVREVVTDLLEDVWR